MNKAAGATAGLCFQFPEAHCVHSSAEIEWWYQFAFLNDRYTLMSCFWRYQALGLPAGLMACYALTEIRGDRRWQGTWIDPAMLHLSREVLKRETHPDLYTQCALEITENGRSFAPYDLACAAHMASSAAFPVEVSVESCHLTHDSSKEQLHLRVSHDGLEANLKLDLAANMFPMNGTGDFEFASRSMSGYTFPQTSVGGELRIDGELHPVTGKAWLDHLWGDWQFDLAHRGSHADEKLEWIYFAVPFDDGRSLVLALNDRQAQSEIVYGCLCQADGRVDKISRAKAVCHDHIESLRTRNTYQYGWSLDLPEFDASLEFVPFHPDHEVLTFTRERAIFEVGVDVTGTLHGQPCRARGFVETFGEAIDVADSFWRNRPARMKAQIQKVAPKASSPEWLQRLTGLPQPLAIECELVDRALLQPIWSMVDRGGKAWRSSWFVLCCHALGFNGSDDRLRELMPVVELIHTGSLIIDDIQDESVTRRGVPALHRQIGTDLAINAGNFLYFLPMLLIQELTWLTDRQRLEAYHRIAIGQRQGHLGQALDLMWSKSRYDVIAKVENFEQTRDELLEQYRLKCGCQLEAAARIAGSLAEAPPCYVSAVSDYSQSFGVVYQLVDDVNDAGGESADFGKSTGEDLRNGRLNMVLLQALAAASPQRRAPVLEAIANGAGANHAADVQQLIAETGALQSCLDLADRILFTARSCLEAIPASDARIGLECAPRSLLEQARKRLKRYA